MYNAIVAARRRDELNTELKRAMKNPVLTAAQQNAIMDRIEAEAEELNTAEKTYKQARAFGDTTASTPSGMPSNKGFRQKAAPIAFEAESMQAMHKAITSRQSLQIKAFSSVDPLLPAQLSPYIVGPIHENRLLDRLPVEAVDAPSWEYIRHLSTTGAAAIVAEGAPKPELVFVTDKVIATVQKIACHAGISWESLNDYGAFVGYLQSELVRQLTDVENLELLSGAGTAGHLTGFLSTSGILTHAVTTETSLDAVEISIAQLRTGSSLAEANLLVLHPNTWGAMRRTKDAQGRYLVNPDPTQGQGNQLWGVEVLTTTVQAAGVGLLLDTNKFGKVLVRDSITMLTGTNNDDLIRNVVRFVLEERLALAVERPSAVLSITGLPTS